MATTTAFISIGEEDSANAVLKVKSENNRRADKRVTKRIVVLFRD